MSKLVKYATVYLFVIFLFLFSATFVLAAPGDIGACVDLKSYACLPGYEETQCITDFGGDDGTYAKFFIGKVCDINDGELPDILERNGCCCIQSNDTYQTQTSQIVNSENTCNSAKNRNLTSYTDLITNRNACNSFCRDTAVYTDPDEALLTCAQAQGSWCRQENILDGAIEISFVNQSGKPFGTVCVPQEKCGVAQEACIDLLSANPPQAYEISRTQYCPAQYLKGSGENSCCEQRPIEASCGARGGSYCDNRVADDGIVVNGCIRDSYIVDDDLIGNMSGKEGRSCCLNGCYAAPDTNDPFETFCNDGIDNDGNGYTDELDSVCQSTISGSVTPITQARNIEIQAKSTRSGSRTYTTLVNNDGTYSFTNLAENTTYIVQIKDNRFNVPPAQVSFGTSGPDSKTVDFVLNANSFTTLSGRINNSNGDFVEGAFVYLRGTQYSAMTDVNGYYTIANVERSKDADGQPTTQPPYNVSVFAPNHIPYFHPALLEIYSPVNQTKNFEIISNNCNTDDEAIQIGSLEHTSGKPEVKIIWGESKCTAFVESYKLMRRCIPTNPSNGLGVCDETLASVAIIQDGKVTNYVDTQPLWEKQYEYILFTKFRNKDSIPSEPKDILLGNALCDGRTAEPFCADYISQKFLFDPSVGNYASLDDKPFYGGVTCTSENTVIDGLECNVTDDVRIETCIESPTNQGTQISCVGTDVCIENTKDKPFGFFSTDCEDRGDGESFSCYVDKGETSVNTCLLCNPEKTCADYQTESACNADENTCNIAFAGSGCDWNPTDGLLGLGVCVDKDLNLCSSCNDNGGSFGVCDRLSCEAYSTDTTTCRYSETQSTCASAEETTCYDFANSDTCPVGEDVPASCKFGSITPDPNYCFKDSLRDTFDDCTPGTEDHNLNISVLSITQCHADNIVPETFVLPPSRVIPTGDFRSDILFSVVDRGSVVVDVPPAKSTHYCLSLADRQGLCGDESSYKRVENGVVSITTDVIEYFSVYSQNITLHYFSIDHANNKEAKRELPLYVDNSGPSIGPLLVTSTFENPSSSGTLFFTTSKTAVCTIVVYLADEYSAGPSVESTTHTFGFSSFEDGSYEAIISCIKDDVETTVTREFVIDGDTRITNPLPTGGGVDSAVDTDPTVEVSFLTTEDVDCRYIETQPGEYTTAGFSQMPNANTFTSIQQGNYQKHYFQTRTLTKGLYDYQYEYFVSCNGFSDGKPATQRISFTYDPIYPEVTARDVDGELFNFDIMRDSQVVTFSCSDSPVGGFGCDSIRYCRIPYYSYQGADQSTCIPNLEISTGDNLVFGRSEKICFEGIENSNGDYGPYKPLAPICKVVLAQEYKPQFTFTNLPFSTNERSVLIEGSINAISYSEETITLSDTGDQFQQKFIVDDEQLFLDAEVRVEVDLSQTAASRPYVDVYLRESDTYPAYGARIDLRGDVNPPSFEIISSQSVEPLEKISISNINISELQKLVLRVEGNKITATLGQTVLTHTFVGTVNPGTASIVTQGLSAIPTVGLSQYRIVDLSEGNQLVTFNVTPYIFGTNNLNTFANTEKARVIDANPFFSANVGLSQAPDLQHGSNFMITIAAQNDGGQRAESVTHNILYDIEGPTVSNISFAIIEDQRVPEQGDKIISGQDARVTIKLYDESELGKTYVQVGRFVREVTVEQKTSDGIVGRISTIGFPKTDFIGLNVTVIAEDILGNTNNVTFPNKLHIDLPLNFPVLKWPAIYYTKTGDVAYTIEVTDAEPDMDVQSFACYASYVAGNGREQNVSFTPIAQDLTMDITFPEKVSSTPNEEIITNVLIYCTLIDLATQIKETYPFNQEVIYDLHKPIFSIKPQSDLVELENFTSTHKTYIKHDYLGERLVFEADEPVKCVFVESPSNTLFTPTSEEHKVRAQSKLIYPDAPVADSIIEPITTYEVSCKDRANNTAVNNRLISFIVVSNESVSLYDWAPTGYVNDSSVEISVLAYNAARCGVEIGTTPSIPLQRSSGTKPVYAKTFSLGDGEYSYVITCSHTDPNFGDETATGTFILDRIAPTLSINITDANSVQVSTVPLSANMDEDGTITITNGASISSFSVLSGQDIPSNYEVPLTFGSNTIIITATDAAGNKNTEIRQIVRERKGVSLEIKGLRDTVVGYVSDIDVYVEHGDIAISLVTFTAEFIPTNPAYQLDSITGISTTTSIITFPVESKGIILANGNYTLVVKATNLDGTVLAQTSTLFEVDVLAPTNTILLPTERVESSGENVEVYTNYTNYIATDVINITSRRNDITQTIPTIRAFENLIGSPTNYAEGISFVEVSSTNDLGKTGTANQLTFFDVEAPVVNIALVGSSDDITFNLYPVFEITLSEPGQILDIYVTKSGESKRYFVSRPDGLATKFTAFVEEELSEDGAYTIFVDTVDENNNFAESPSQYTFTLEKGQIRAKTINPTFGITDKVNDIFVIQTDRLANCRYSTSANTPYNAMNGVFKHEFGNIGEGLIHNTSAISFTEFPVTYYVKCASVANGVNNGSDALVQILQLDTTSPVLEKPIITNANAEGVVITAQQPNLLAETDDKTFCAYSYSNAVSFDDETKIFNSSTSLQTINQVKNGFGVGNTETKTIYVQCQNGAERLSNVESVKISKDISVASDLELISPKDGFATIDEIVVIKIKTGQPTDIGNCYYQLDGSEPLFFTTSNRTVFESTTTTLSEDKHDLIVYCNIDGKPSTLTTTFYVDKTAPEFKEIKVDNVSSDSSSRLEAELVFTDEVSGINEYHYAIGTAKYGTPGWNSLLNQSVTTRAKIKERDLNLTDGQTYYWSARAIDNAGNKGGWFSSNGTLVEKSDDDSTGGPKLGSQTCFDGKENQDETDIDCGGLICGACATAGTCELSGDCQSQICQVGLCEAPSCTDGIQNGFETDVDCGTDECGSCSIGKRCAQTSNCVLGSVCSGGFCVDAHCSNGAMDKDETDVDCGGSTCSSCSEGSSCSVNTDCATGLCDNNICKDSQKVDTDGDGMPDYWEDQNGLDKRDPNDAQYDPDADDLTNYEEYLYLSPVTGIRLNPQSADTDFDGRNDGRELLKDNTDPTDSNDYKKALSWAIWLLLFIILLILLLAGYFGYNYYQDQQTSKTVNTKSTTVRTFNAQPQTGQPKLSLHDELKKSLSERVKREHSLMAEGHPVFAKEQGANSSTNVKEVVTVEETEEVVKERKRAEQEKKDRDARQKTRESDIPQTKRTGSALDALSQITKDKAFTNAKPLPKPTVNTTNKSVSKSSIGSKTSANGKVKPVSKASDSLSKLSKLSSGTQNKESTRTKTNNIVTKATAKSSTRTKK